MKLLERLWQTTDEDNTNSHSQSGEEPSRPNAQPSGAKQPPADGPPPPTVAGLAPEPNDLEPDPLTKLERECYAFGFDEGRHGWALKPDPEICRMLEAKATAKAYALHRPLSDTVEQRRLIRINQLFEQQDQRTAARDRAAAEHQERERDLADLDVPGPRPVLSFILRWAVTLGLTVSIAPTIHDLFADLDAFLAWLAGGVIGWGLALLIVWGIQPGDDNHVGGDDDAK